MAITGQEISVSTSSAVLLAQASVDRPLTVYLGNQWSNVTLAGDAASAAGGFWASDLPTGQNGKLLPLTLQPGDALYAISNATSTVTVNVLAFAGA